MKPLKLTPNSPDMRSIFAMIGSTGSSAILRPVGSVRRPESSIPKSHLTFVSEPNQCAVMTVHLLGRTIVPELLLSDELEEGMGSQSESRHPLREP